MSGLLFVVVFFAAFALWTWALVIIADRSQPLTLETDEDRQEREQLIAAMIASREL